MKTKKVFHFIVLFLIYCVGWEPLGAQNPEWKVYTSGEYITALAEEGDFLWVGTTGGLVRMNKLTGEATFYNNVNSELPYNDVRSIAIDGYGSKWIISRCSDMRSLSQFDGNSWKSFDMTDRSFNSFRPIMAVDGHGYIWLGYAGALYKFDGTAWTTYDIPQIEGTDQYRTYPVAVDDSGRVWVGTTNGMMKFDGTTWTYYTTSNSGSPSNYISCMDIDIDGNLWLVSSYNDTSGWDPVLTRFDGTLWTRYDVPHSETAGYELQSLEIDRNGNIWIPTDDGLAKFNGSNWTVFEDTCKRYPLLCDKDGYVWLSDYHGLIRFDGSTRTRFKTSNSGLHYPGVSCIAFEPSGKMWLGTLDPNSYGWVTPSPGEILEVADASWMQVDLSSDYPYYYHSAAIDSQGNKWFASSFSGLVKYDGASGTAFVVDDSGEYIQRVNALAVDPSGKLWVGTIECLRRFDGTHWTRYTGTDSGFQLTSVQSLAPDPKGGLWIGTFHGLVKYDATGWADYTTSNSGLPANSIDHLAVDSGGNLWIVTGASLVKFDGSKWAVEELPSPEGPYSWYITSLAIDGKGSVWLTDNSNGLLAFNGGKWTSYTTSNSGLPDNSVFCIAFDSKGNKWIGTNNGLAVFNEGGIVAVRPPTPQEQSLPRHFALSQNYPNPFNPTTTIRYELSANCFVSLKVYDILGREVKTLVNEVKKMGRYEVQFDASGLASGVYFYRIRAGNFAKTMKLMLVK